jgi:transmembrane sensor
MGNLLRFPDPRNTMREASLWLVAIEEGLAEDERRKLEEWLASDPRHEEALRQLARVWGAFDALAELAEIFPLDRYRARRTWPSLLKIGTVAATAAGVAALGWYLMAGFVAPNNPDPILVSLPELRGTAAPGAAADRAGAAQRSYETAVGEQLSARLPDGSVITLNTNTLLDVDYSDSQRLVTLRRGEASFNVISDTRPFRVFARTTAVQAVGTIFNVQLDASDRVEVTVSEGRVRVTVPDRQPLPRPPGVETRDAPVPPGVDMTVAAGELAVIDGPDEAVRRMDALEIESRLAWQQGMLVFRGAPLEAVLADVSRYTTVKFTIADDSIRSKRVGGYFRTGDVDGLLVALRESFDIEPRRVGDEIVLTARQ